MRHPTEKSNRNSQRPHLLSPMTKLTEEEIHNRMKSPVNLQPSAGDSRKDMRRQSDFAFAPKSNSVPPSPSAKSVSS